MKAPGKDRGRKARNVINVEFSNDEDSAPAPENQVSRAAAIVKSDLLAMIRAAIDADDREACQAAMTAAVSLNGIGIARGWPGFAVGGRHG